MVVFGTEVKGANSGSFDNVCFKSLFTCPSAGRLDHIDIYLKRNLLNGDTDVGIYDGLVLLGSKTHTVVAGEDDWHEVDFSDLVIDLTNKVYGLAFKNHVSSTYYSAVGAVNQTQRRTGMLAADHIPNPFVINAQENTMKSIHAHYTPVGGGVAEFSKVKVGGRCL